jgi:calnexin
LPLQKKIFDVLYKIADIPFLAPYKTKIIVSFGAICFPLQSNVWICYQENNVFLSISCTQDVIEKGEKQPNITIGILVSVVIVFVTVLFKILFGGKKPVVSYSQPM